jgi:hypothetical protein
LLIPGWHHAMAIRFFKLDQLLTVLIPSTFQV